MEFMVGVGCLVVAVLTALWLALRRRYAPAQAAPVPADPYAAEVAAFRRDLGDWLRG